MTVALIDAYGYPGIQADLSMYRKYFGLPACAKGCFSVVNQKGKAKPLPKVGPSNNDWRGEQALDMDMVSAICPNCKILLVQTDDNGNGNLAAGVDTAVKLGADIVSNSYGCPESYCTPAATNPSYDHKGVLILASAGDSGAEAAQPCDLSSIICVGGTSVAESKSGQFTETVWDGLVKRITAAAAHVRPAAVAAASSRSRVGSTTRAARGAPNPICRRLPIRIRVSSLGARHAIRANRCARVGAVPVRVHR